MSVSKIGNGKKGEWWLDPQNLPEIVEMFENGDIMIFPSPPPTEDEMEETSRLIAEYRAARRTANAREHAGKQVAYV